ncbi:MAG: PP2C family protein-serine/threonine phosphatase [Bacillota bacterium]
MHDTAAISADQVKLVLDVSRLLVVTADLDLLLKRIAEAATSLLSTERASIFLHDPQTNELWTKVALGASQIRVPATAGVVGHVFKTNQLVEVPHPYDDPRFNPDPDHNQGFVTRNLLTAPMHDVDGRPLGVLQAVNRIGGSFTPADHAMITLLADQAGVAIQRYRLQQEVTRATSLRHEMDLAQKVQAAMIPAQPPHVPNLNVVGWMRSASFTGGDCYDLWPMDNDRLGIFLGDASGHGVPAALVISQVRSLIRALAEVNRDPTWLLTSVNSRLAYDLEAGRFATALVGSLDSQGSLRWSSAGHGPVLLRPRPDAPFQAIEAMGPPIGISPDLRIEPPMSVNLEPGGLLVLMSDGVFESRSPAGTFLGLDRVIEVLDQSRTLSPSEMLASLRQLLHQWQGHEEPMDDQTLVIAQYCPLP